MKQSISIAILTLLLSSTTSAQFNYSRYRPALLDTLARHLADILEDPSSIAVAPGVDAFRVRVIYADSLRPIEVDKATVLQHSYKAFSMGINAEELYRHEMCVWERGREYWIPVQEPLLVSFSEELERGDEVDLYITCVGATKGILVFTINEFNAEID